MNEVNATLSDRGRRMFLKKIVGCPLVLGVGGILLGADAGQQPPAAAAKAKHKFQDGWGLSYAEAFQWAYAGVALPILQGLRKEMGGIDFIALLKKITEEFGRQAGQAMAQGSKKNDFASYMAFVFKNPDPVFNHALT